MAVGTSVSLARQTLCRNGTNGRQACVRERPLPDGTARNKQLPMPSRAQVWRRRGCSTGVAR